MGFTLRRSGWSQFIIDGGACVQLARKDGFVAMHSDRPGLGWGSPMVTFTDQEFAVFAEDLGNGEFGAFSESD